MHNITITNPDKLLYKGKNIVKKDFIEYLLLASKFMLPFLQNRCLTLIRYPHGMFGESFFQKNCPSYAPDFIKTYTDQNIEYILCNDLETLIWLGNQLAFEYHIPFETIYSKGYPSEIVLDLDPPSRNDFNLAIYAAQSIQEVLENLKLTAYIKTSGNKGLQVYIPLPEQKYSYEQTRQFTKFVADFLIAKDPKWFTINRLKKDRGKKLYIDYLQHARGKTIIAPYSPRGNNDALIATPIHWTELNDKLSPEHFTLNSIKQRLSSIEDPFAKYFETKYNQPFQPVLDFLQSK